MKILITGICGFVGSTLAMALQEHRGSDSLEITGIDNLSRSGSWRNKTLLQERTIKVLHGDIRSPSDLEALGPFDWVIDAAANPSVLAGIDGKSSSRQLVEHNLGGTVNLLEACRKWGAGFLLLSTSRVYSIAPLSGIPVNAVDQAFQPLPNNIPGLTAKGIAENFSTVPPVSLYGVTKLASESLALEYGAAFGFPVWINRCGVMAGAGQFGRPDQGIFAYWLHSWKEGRPLKYIGFGGLGHQVRDCLHPRDLAPLLLKQFGASAGEPASSRICNVSGGTKSARSLAQLTEWCRDRFPHHHQQPVADPKPRPFDLPWVVLDHSAATRKWDWIPTTTADQILTEIADFADTQPAWIQFSA